MGNTASPQTWMQTPDLMRLTREGASGTGRHWLTENFSGTSEGHAGPVTSVSFASYDAHIQSISWDRTSCVWSSQDGSPIAGPQQWPGDWSAVLALSQDTNCIIFRSYDRSTHVYDLRSGNIITGPCSGHAGMPGAACFSPDNMWVASGSDDWTIRVWDAQTGKPLVAPLEGHTGGVSSLAFSPDSTRIVSGSYDATIRVWDLQDGHAVTFIGHNSSVMCVAFSPDGTRIISGSYFDNTVCVWDAQSGVMSSGPLRGHTGRVESVSCSPDNIYIASGSHDGTIRIWDVRTGSLAAKPLMGHIEAVYSVAFSPDGNCIASGSEDCTIRIWNVQSMIPTGTSPFNIWTLVDSGWIVGSGGQLLLWVPPHLRSGLGRADSRNRLVIRSRVPPQININLDTLLLSDCWRESFLG
jgi:WD40 repeat protein